MSAVSYDRNLAGESRKPRTMGSCMGQGSNVSIPCNTGSTAGNRMKQGSGARTTYNRTKTMGKRMSQ